jgi:hypothetical protein
VFKVQTYHLIGLSKEGAGFKHYEFASLDTEWTLFQLYRKAYDLDLDCVADAPKKPRPAKAKPDLAKPAEAKPRIRIKAQSAPAPALTMAEALRAADKQAADHIWRKAASSNVDQMPPHGLFGGAQ